MTIKAGNKQKEKGYQWRKWTNWEKTWACLLKDQKNITDERKLWRILVSDVRVWSNKLNQVSFTRFFTNDRKNILTNKFQCLASLKRRYLLFGNRKLRSESAPRVYTSKLQQILSIFSDSVWNMAIPLLYLLAPQ